MNILLVSLELGTVPELDIAKSAVRLGLDVPLPRVELHRVETHKLQVTEPTGILPHGIADIAPRQQMFVLLMLLLEVSREVERLLERFVA